MSAPPTASRPLPAPLLNRYELLDELPHVTGGRLFRARDLAFAELVGVKQFGPGCGLPPAARLQLEAIVRHLQCLPHPNLVRFYAFDAGAGLLVQEWIQGVSLLDLLRRRRGLPVHDVVRILADLPATLDFLAREAVPTPCPLLAKLFIQFEESSAAERAITAPVEQWPLFTLKLNALSLRSLVAFPAGDETTNSAIADPSQPTETFDRYAPREFARLLYELLGGRIRELDARRYIPIAALREAGNAVLQRALLAMPLLDSQSLWRDLLGAQSEFQRLGPVPVARASPPSPAWRIPGPLLHGADPGSILNLDPTTPGATPIRLVARPRLHIGRSPQQADFVTRLLPENEANQALNNRFGRVHAILEIVTGTPQARDGNGQGPSLNGSSLDGQPLSSEQPTPLTPRSLLCLGRAYSLELVRVLPPAPPAPPIDNLDAWPGPKETHPTGLSGAFVGLPAGGQPAIRHTAWLFSEVGFSLDASGDLVWDTRGCAQSPGAFHYHRGCFWLSNRSLPRGALVGHHPLSEREIAPLVAGQTISLGSRAYLVHLD